MNIDKERFLKLTEILSPEGDLIYFSRLEGGVSCDVFLLEVKEGTKINKFVVRTEGLPTSENTVETEFYLLKSISNKQVPTAEAFYFDNSCEILDKPFMVMSFLEGTIFEPKEREFSFLEIMAKQLICIHQTDIAYLPELPLRTDPLDGLISYLPKESRWDELSSLIKGLNKEIFEGEKVFLHGDFWLGNLLWKDSLIVGILDWEYAAIGDPLSDLATACLEVRYEVGIMSAMPAFIVGMLAWIYMIHTLWMGEGAEARNASGNAAVQTAYNTMMWIIIVGWAIYPIGYASGYLMTGGIDASSLNLIYNLADFVNKILFGVVIWSAAVSDSES